LGEENSILIILDKGWVVFEEEIIANIWYEIEKSSEEPLHKTLRFK
jgi:hypothetical protein